jgi:S1-C subfamily serine protease
MKAIRLITITLLILIFNSDPVEALVKKIPFRINSDPPGAKVEINGREVGVTPYQREIEDWMVQGHGRWVFSKFLGESITLTISKEGYFPKTMVITQGPLRWVNSNGTAVHYFYVIVSTEFNIKLDKKVEFTSTNPFSSPAASPATTSNSTGAINTLTSTSVPAATGVTSRLSTEEIVANAMPCVVTIRTENGSGSGFLITDTGVVVTNKHVLGSNTSAFIISSTGETYKSESIYAHPSRDLALIKVSGTSFPYLRLANPATVNAGADVVAIGSPGIGSGSVLAGTVTKGIISAFRTTIDDGVLIQTDVSINPGNSGGPLLNSSAEVVGINTMKIVSQGIEGLNFAIFSSEVLQMLKDHFNFTPQYSNPIQTIVSGNDTASNNASRLSAGTQTGTSTQTQVATTEAKPAEKMPVQITSEPAGADIYIGDTYVGSTPSKIMLGAGEHIIRVTRPGFSEWQRKVRIEIGTSMTFNAILEKSTGT